MKKTVVAGLLAFPLMMSTPVWADKITDQINAGLKAYEAQDYKEAVDELKFVMAQINKLANEKNKKLLPDALSGWTKKKVNNRDSQIAMSILGGGTTIKGSYKKGKQQVDIEVIANSPMLAMMGMMINNPAMISADNETEPFRYKRIKGIKKTHRGRVEITLLIAGQIMLKVEGRKLEDESVLEKYLDGIDIKKLKAELL